MLLELPVPPCGEIQESLDRRETWLIFSIKGFEMNKYVLSVRLIIVLSITQLDGLSYCHKEITISFYSVKFTVVASKLLHISSVI